MDVGALTLDVLNSISSAQCSGPSGLAIGRARNSALLERPETDRPARRTKQGPNRRVHIPELRSTKWKLPSVIAQTKAKWLHALLEREGGLWARVKRTVIVAGYSKSARQERARPLRSEGAESMAATLVCLMASSDLKTGEVVSHRRGERRRLKQRDIAQFAFGAQGAWAIKRTQRALSALESLGLLVIEQVRHRRGDGSFYSEAAVVRLNWVRLCEMAGTTWLLKGYRRRAEDAGKTGPEAAVDEPQPHISQRPNQFRAMGRVVGYSRGDPPSGRSPTEWLNHVAELLVDGTGRHNHARNL